MSNPPKNLHYKKTVIVTLGVATKRELPDVLSNYQTYMIFLCFHISPDYIKTILLPQLRLFPLGHLPT